MKWKLRSPQDLANFSLIIEPSQKLIAEGYHFYDMHYLFLPIIREKNSVKIFSGILTFGKCMFLISSRLRLLYLLLSRQHFQKTNNFYKLGSFNHWFSIWKSFLDTKEKILLVPLQKRPSYLDYKMLVKVDCAVITMSSRGLFKSLLLKCYSNKNLPTLTNTSG